MEQLRGGAAAPGTGLRSRLRPLRPAPRRARGGGSLSPRRHQSQPSRERAAAPAAARPRAGPLPSLKGAEGTSSLWDEGRGQRSRTSNTVSISAFGALAAGRRWRVAPSCWPAVTRGQRGFVGFQGTVTTRTPWKWALLQRMPRSADASCTTELQERTRSRKKGRTTPLKVSGKSEGNYGALVRRPGRSVAVRPPRSRLTSGRAASAGLQPHRDTQPG
ncbi:uncharacterized protein LOC128810369 [Vidua macroura]|uniref:uncharacterized protein LOC128810369 n=1 Tax=Vidua macroura TaxID=187451 RepID=UPI0023A7DD7B|nr:uncharacterized protein LOC128810369 [Vidua macroura]